MKNPFQRILSVLALVSVAVGLNAQPALKIATVDVNRLFEGYYKTEEERTKLNEVRKKAEDQLQQMQKDLETIRSEGMKLVEDSESAILNEEARAKAKQGAEQKNSEFQQKQADLRNFAGEAEGRIRQRWGNYQQVAIEQIAKTAVEIGKRKGATIVMTKAELLYADASFDITDEVLAEINKDRPAPSATATPAQPAPAATPAQ